jgi:hypothetical protein
MFHHTDQSDSVLARSIPGFEKSAGCEIASRARCIFSILTVHKADKITKADFKPLKELSQRRYLISKMRR